MAANATIKKTSVLHAGVVPLFAAFGMKSETPEGIFLGWTYNNSYRANYCTKVILQAGADPSMAIIAVNMNNPDETAPALAACRSGAMQAAVKHNTPVLVYQNGALLFWGHVAEVEQDLERDRLIVTAKDLRWRLNKTQVVGSFWIDGPWAQTYPSAVYRQGEPFIVNPGGQPNMQYAVIGNLKYIFPVMCPVNYGGDIAGRGAARHWTARDVMKALRMFGDPAVLGTEGAVTSVFSAWIPQWPLSLVWPDTLGLELESGADRKFPEMRLDGGKMADLLQKVISSAGPYALYLGSDGQAGAVDGTLIFNSSLSIVRTAYDGEGISYARPMRGKPSQRMKVPRYVGGGTLSENSDDLYGKVAVAGGPVFIERRIDCDAATMQLQWTTAAQAGLGTYIAARLNAGRNKQLATQEAFGYYPTVGAAYAVAPSFDFQADTWEAGMPRSTLLLRPILPHLLAAYTGNTSVFEARTMASYRKPIIVEYKDGAAWKIAGLADGLRVDADGTFWLTGLRDRGLTLSITVAGIVPNLIVTVTPRKLRMTVVVPCDHRLFAVVDTENAFEDMDADGKSAQEDSERILEQPETLFIDAGDLYDCEVQRDSWPIPESVTGATAQAATLRLDLQPLDAHAFARWKQVTRLKKRCVLRFPRIEAVPIPGTSIKELVNTGLTAKEISSGKGTYPVRAVVQRLTITNEPGNQSADVECSL